MWPEYNVEERQMLRFTDVTEMETESEEARENYNFWNGEFQDIARPEDVHDNDPMSAEGMCNIVE